MQVLRCETLPPSGIEHAVTLRLLPSTVNRKRTQDVDGTYPKVVCNMVAARSNFLRIYEIVEENVSIQAQGRSKQWSRFRKDTEAVEGEVEMDTQGEGFVNMGAVKVVLLFIIYVIELSCCVASKIKFFNIYSFSLCLRQTRHQRPYFVSILFVNTGFMVLLQV